MKKLIAFVLATVCVFALVGCNNTQPEYEEPNFTEIQTIVSNDYSDFDGISIQASGIYVHPDKTTIVINWRNDTEYSVIYGEAYSIERLENGEWVSCALMDTAFDAIAYELRAKKLGSKAYTLTGMYDVNKPGTYRFLSTCNVDTGEGKSTECSVWAEFILE
ncbi:MAG: hypothetical protein IJB47_04825 [Oscillospiraceae bacterium]|nr:hypothetical protein [Oscillospiraceae bacterium]